MDPLLSESCPTLTWTRKWHHFADIYCLCYGQHYADLIKRLEALGPDAARRILTTDSADLTLPDGSNSLLGELADLANARGPVQGWELPWPEHLTLGVRAIPQTLPLSWRKAGITPQLLRHEMVLTPDALYLLWPLAGIAGTGLQHLQIKLLDATEFDPQRDALLHQLLQVVDNQILMQSASTSGTKVSLRQAQQTFDGSPKTEADHQARTQAMKQALHSWRHPQPGQQPERVHVMPDMVLQGDLTLPIERTRLWAQNGKLGMTMGLQDETQKERIDALVTNVWPCGNLCNSPC